MCVCVCSLLILIRIASSHRVLVLFVCFRCNVSVDKPCNVCVIVRKLTNNAVCMVIIVIIVDEGVSQSYFRPGTVFRMSVETPRILHSLLSI